MKRKNVSTQLIKEYIAEALLLLMNTKDYKDISISEITQKAGVNRSTYYRNFISKEDVVKFSLENILFSYISEFQNTPYTNYKDYLYVIFCHLLKYKHHLIMIKKNALSYLLLDVFNTYFESKLVNTFSTSQDKFRIFYHTGGIYNFLILWMNNNMEESPEQMTEIALSIFPKDYTPLLMPVLYSTQNQK